MYPLIYRCPHGAVELEKRQAPDNAPMSERYVIKSLCPCNGTAPDLGMGCKISVLPPLENATSREEKDAFDALLARRPPAA